MENSKSIYIPVGQAVKTNYINVDIRRFVKNNKLKLIIGLATITLLSIYGILITNFIGLLKILS